MMFDVDALKTFAARLAAAVVVCAPCASTIFVGLHLGWSTAALVLSGVGGLLAGAIALLLWFAYTTKWH